MSIAEKLRESLKTLVPVVPLGQNEENNKNKATYVNSVLGPVGKNRLVPLVPSLVPDSLPDTMDRGGISRKLSSDPEPINHEELDSTRQSERLAHWDQGDQTKMPFPETDIQTSGPSQRQFDEDPVSMGERIGIKYGSETPDTLGDPVIRHPANGAPLAYVNDEPHVKVFAWALLNLRFAPWEKLDIWKLATDCGLSTGEARSGLNRLIQDGDVKVERDRGREYYWLAPPKYGETGE
jgi:hypothetical protein